MIAIFHSSTGDERCSYCRFYRTCLNRDNDGLTLPAMCEDFMPKLVSTCSYCGGVINKPYHSWKHWVEMKEDKLPVCSPRCRRKFKERLAESESVSR